MVKLNSIHINPANPRLIKDERFKKLCQSIKEFPKMMKLRPIVIDTEGMILGGNMRFKALKELGYKEVPDEWIKRDGELTDEEKQRFIIADNIESGEWEWDMLNDWDKDLLEEWGLDLPDFTDGNNHNKWNIQTDTRNGETDGTEEILGYKLSSMWYDMPRTIEGLTEKLIELPLVGRNSTRGTIVTEGGKYSRSIPEEIRRVVVTYMTKGDYFLENCCGWSTFGAIAKIHGYSGVGVDIWDVALESSRRQINVINNNATVEIIEMDGMNLLYDNEKFDFIYCNPPFMDAEMYSGKPNDIACRNEKEFKSKFLKLMQENYRVLKNDSLCVITIADQRKNKVLISNSSIVIQIGIDAGFILYDFVVAETIGIANVLRKKSLEVKRTPKNHEYIIVFKKL